MPLNIKKGYNFKPDFPDTGLTECRIQVHSALFSRLHINDLFFRSLERGQASNKISLSLSEVIVDHSRYTRLTVTSPFITATSYTGIGTGAIGGIAVSSMPPQKTYEIVAIDSKLFHNDVLGDILVDKPYRNSHLALMIFSGMTRFVPGDKFVISISGGTEIHDTPTITPTTTSTIDPATGITSTTTDPDPTVPNLRAVVNANSKMVRMPARGIDRTDLEGEDLGYATFTNTFMSDGDGLPVNASGIKNGPDRAFSFINFSENENGQQAVIAKVFEWVGDDVYNGEWKIYS